MLKILVSALFVTFALPVLAQQDVCNQQPATAVSAQQAPVAMSINCVNDYDCGYGNICQYGQCQPAQCLSDNTCMPWEKCDQGRCQRDPWAYNCQTDQTCAA